LQGDSYTFTAQNARFTVACKECERPRLIYGKSMLTERHKVQLALLLSNYEFTCGSPITPPDHPLHVALQKHHQIILYMWLSKNTTRSSFTCGSPITPPDHPLHGKLIVHLNIDCSSCMETSYYSSNLVRPDVCYYCGCINGDIILQF
jgi:hypothetical protein